MAEFDPSRVTPPNKARHLVFDYVRTNNLTRGNDYTNFHLEMVRLVWFSKTLQNWKALVMTDLLDDIYYEVTHNGDKKETYLDVYIKTDNVLYDLPRL